MFKFGEEVVGKYVESPQQNPLRWEMLYRDEEGTFHLQTGKMMLKIVQTLLKDMVNCMLLLMQ